jgi:phosphohistidine phosphatase
VCFRPEAAPTTVWRPDVKPIDLLIVRHGTAEDQHALGDEARALTAEGRDEFRAHARRVAKRIELQGIATSPLVRAVQTAEILARACKVNRVIVRRELVPERATNAALAALAAELGPGWAIVGHNPSLASLVAHLVGRKEPVDLRKGAAVALHLRDRPGSYEVAWSGSPGKKFKARLR